MVNGGMVLGSHTNSHPVMSKLSADEQLSELDLSFRFLDELCVNQDRTYCHPYGGFHSFNDKTIKALEKLNVLYSFNVEPRDIGSKDFISGVHFLPRYDCNLFLFGTAS